MTIIVEGGHVFEGTFEQWEDCFFSFPDGYLANDKIEMIKSFCLSNGFKFEIAD